MSIPLSFRHDGKILELSLQKTDNPKEKSVTIDGRDYKLLGSEEVISLVLSQLKSSSFESFYNFKVSLSQIKPQKPNTVFQQTLENRESFSISDMKTALPVTTPKLSGPHSVGVVADELIDNSRTEIYAKGSARKFKIKTYYPSQGDKEAVKNKYQILPGLKPALGFKEEDVTPIDLFYTHAEPGQKPAEIKAPVIFFSHGFGFYADDYVELYENLASHGFIVIALEHPYTASFSQFSDGSEMAVIDDAKLNKKAEILQRQQDIEFLLQQIKKGKVRHFCEKAAMTADLNRIGICGHSLGGTTALEVCKKLKNINAGVNLDGSLEENYSEKFEKPFLTVLSGNNLSNPPPGNTEKEQWQTMKARWKGFDEANKNTATTIKIKNANHTEFSIDPVFQNITNRVASKNPHRVVQETVVHLVKFFEQHLKN